MSKDLKLRAYEAVRCVAADGSVHRMRASERAVLLALAHDAARATSRSRLTNAQIKDYTGLSGSGVARALATLQRSGHIVREEGEPGAQWTTLVHPLVASSTEKFELTRRSKAKIGRGLARMVFERDEYRCLNCRSHLNLTCDHIVPESRGGATSLANLQTLCGSCNSAKGSKLP